MKTCIFHMHTCTHVHCVTCTLHHMYITSHHTHHNTCIHAHMYITSHTHYITCKSHAHMYVTSHVHHISCTPHHRHHITQKLMHMLQFLINLKISTRKKLAKFSQKNCPQIRHDGNVARVAMYENNSNRDKNI